MNIEVGTIIKIIKMHGEEKYQGKIGQIIYIDSIGQLHGTWGGCAINLSVDEIEIVNNLN